MMETEKIIGVDGTYALFDTTSEKTEPTERTLSAFKDLPFEHKIPALATIIALSGSGKNEDIRDVQRPLQNQT